MKRSSILDGILNGEVCPQEQMSPSHAERREVSQKIDMLLDRLRGMLNEEGCELLEELEDLFVQSTSRYSKSYFVGGFRLGARMICEVYIEGEPASDR